MNDEDFLKKFYHNMVEGSEEEKNDFKKKAPKKLTLKQIKKMSEEEVGTHMKKIGCYIKAIAALTACEAILKEGESVKYEAFKGTYEYVTKRFNEIKPKIDELSKEGNQDAFAYFIFSGLNSEGENTKRMFG